MPQKSAPNPTGFDAFLKRSAAPNIKNFKDSLTKGSYSSQHQPPSHSLPHQELKEESTLYNLGHAPPLNADIRFYQNGHSILPPIPKSSIVPPFQSFPFVPEQPNDLEFPIPPLVADIGSYKHFLTDSRSVRDPLSWEHDTDGDIVRNKSTITKSFDEVFLSKFDAPTRKFIKKSEECRANHNEDNSKKDHTIFSTAELRKPNNEVHLLERETFRNGIVQKAVVKTIDRDQLRKSIRIHGEKPISESGEFAVKLGPRQERELLRIEREREEFLKMDRDIRRKKNKLMRIMKGGYRSGVLNQENDPIVYSGEKEEYLETKQRYETKEATRRDCKLLIVIET